MPQTKKKYCISSRYKVNISYHNLPNDITLNAAWKIGPRDHTGNIMQNGSLEKLEKLSSFTHLSSTNFQIETAATAFLCGYFIMKMTEAIHGCDYCLSHLQDSNSKKKIPLLELIYY
jgi:hypothetical protein